jgi:hypothetical protein
LEDATAKKRVESAANEFGQVAAGVFAARVECGELATNDLMEHTFFGLSPGVGDEFFGFDD